jgi:hypothetical protein
MKYFYTYIFAIFLIISCGKKEVTKETVKDETPNVRDVIKETLNEIEEVSEIIFTVQIAALRKENASFRNIENIQVFKEGNLTKYRLVNFSNYQEARSFRASILNMYSDAFVQALKDGVPISIKEALK